MQYIDNNKNDMFTGGSYMLIFNQTSIYYLKRLASRARTKYSQKFRLTNEKDVIELLLFSSSSHDIETKRDFMLFYINCSDHVRDYLSREFSISAPMKNMVMMKQAV
jgi:hypothetical protein